MIIQSNLYRIDEKETRRYAGLSRAKSFDEKKILDVCQTALCWIAPKSVVYEFDYDEKNFLIQNSRENVLLEGNSIRRHLCGCQKILCLAATVGPDIVQEIDAMFHQGNYSDAILLDAAATTAVEQVADDLEKILKEKYKGQGFEFLPRFSPGYGDWNLTFQKELHRLSGAKEIGVSLTDSCMLEPRKSITAVIGLKPNETTLSKKKSCQTCAKQDCPFRR